MGQALCWPEWPDRGWPAWMQSSGASLGCGGLGECAHRRVGLKGKAPPGFRQLRPGTIRGHLQRRGRRGMRVAKARGASSSVLVTLPQCCVWQPAHKCWGHSDSGIRQPNSDLGEPQFPLLGHCQDLKAWSQHALIGAL